ncbi:hypothetical protein, partial [Rhodovulum sulfidophilum]|uniref:hypothetical protein n=1 Tax=Rhodovulum sulfidophilum TaxID=35806 RepID=UPI001F2855FB
ISFGADAAGQCADAGEMGRVIRHARRLEPERAACGQSGDDDLDLRSEEEKAHAAVTNWMRWQGYLGPLDRWQQAAIWGAVRAQTALIRDRQATDEGRG